MDDAGVGWDGSEILERGLAPAEERVTLAVALILDQGVGFEGSLGAELVDLHGVVDDEVDGDERVGFLGIGTHLRQGVAHGGEIDHAGHASEILQQHAGGHEADLFGIGAADAAGDIVDVPGGHAAAIFVPQ